jgi:hypothetical protein
MIFKNRKGLSFQLTVIGLMTLFIGVFILRIVEEEAKQIHLIWPDFLMLGVTSLLLWLYFGTEYNLTQYTLKYKSGPIRGEIKVEQITEILVGKSMWTGLKPATATNGLIIKYGKYEEIYISPQTNETFVKKILEFNQSITITSINSY